MTGSFFFLASCSLGAAQMSLEHTLEYVNVRKQFGKPLADNQVFDNIREEAVFKDPSR